MAETEEELLSIAELLDTGRMREQLELARRIQRAFLPKAPPGLHGYEIDGWNEPCHEAGGDYYDYLRLPGGRLAVAIGDVASHGIGPALLMANARSALRALLQVSKGPGEVLARLNDLLVGDMLDDHFMTMFVGILDLATKRMRYAIAGHERPLLLRRGSDAFERIEGKGMPLGIHESLSYPEGPVIGLNPGDVVAFVTDGVWEASDRRDQEFGYPRLEEVIRKHREGSAREIIAAVRDEVFTHIEGTRQIDDVTLMVLRVL